MPDFERMLAGEDVQVVEADERYEGELRDDLNPRKIFQATPEATSTGISLIKSLWGS